MLLYVARRIVGVIPVALTVVVAVFLILRLSPGDPAALIAGKSATTEQIEHVRVALGLDQPLYKQFLLWIDQLAHGDLGHSVFSNVSVTHLIVQRIEPTLSLTVTTIVFSCLLAIPLGILAAAFAGRLIDRVVMIFSVLSFSFPVFWIGYALVMLFSIQLRLLPVQGFQSITEGIGPFASHIALPTITLGLAYMALLTRMTRGSMLEVLGQDYLRTARAKGLSRPAVLFVHALKNAAVPIMTTIGIGVAFLIGGTVVTENVFGISGLGSLTAEAILTRDYPVIQGLILFFSAIYVVLNLLIDLSYTVLDPRIRY